MSGPIDCTIEGYREEIKIVACSHCDRKGLDREPIQMYPHDYGYSVKEHPEQKQWLYIVCPGCEHEWALWKLGVPI